ncbi:hypothetical protein WICMUC_000782 [Wickerhamomyces mucosus]|uniref:Integral membrane protein n=1 Tax=Wickerhamomyces mucosus TaxID=1378264 RepID=A0A9P8TIB3_9ASCO|nr:hypothetical protein WICMUC_000782 [Wickerhamomyces mucosus]
MKPLNLLILTLVTLPVTLSKNFYLKDYERLDCSYVKDRFEVAPLLVNEDSEPKLDAQGLYYRVSERFPNGTVRFGNPIPQENNTLKYDLKNGVVSYVNKKKGEETIHEIEDDRTMVLIHSLRGEVRIDDQNSSSPAKFVSPNFEFNVSRPGYYCFRTVLDYNASITPTFDQFPRVIFKDYESSDYSRVKAASTILLVIPLFFSWFCHDYGYPSSITLSIGLLIINSLLQSVPPLIRSINPLGLSVTVQILISSSILLTQLLYEWIFFFTIIKPTRVTVSLFAVGRSLLVILWSIGFFVLDLRQLQQYQNQQFYQNEFSYFLPFGLYSNSSDDRFRLALLYIQMITSILCLGIFFPFLTLFELKSFDVKESICNRNTYLSLGMLLFSIICSIYVAMYPFYDDFDNYLLDDYILYNFKSVAAPNLFWIGLSIYISFICCYNKVYRESKLFSKKKSKIFTFKFNQDRDDKTNELPDKISIVDVTDFEDIPLEDKNNNDDDKNTDGNDPNDEAAKIV